MRRHLPFLIYLAALSALAGWLLSHMSWIGHLGVNLMHREYRFLRAWYKGGGLMLAILLLLFGIQYIVQRRLPRASSRGVQIVLLLFALTGLWLTYSDFHSDLTHGTFILKESFHLGAYLFWIGWISISVYMLAAVRRKLPSELQVEG